MRGLAKRVGPTVVARRLRIYTEVASDSITVPDFLHNRFEDKTRLLRVLSAIVILVFFAFYTSAGMVAGAKLFEATFGLDYTVALWGGGAIIVSYTFLGGFLAVAWTDFIQGMIMFFALLIAPALAITTQGGWSETVAQVGAIDASYNNILSGMSLFSIISLEMDINLRVWAKFLTVLTLKARALRPLPSSK